MATKAAAPKTASAKAAAAKAPAGKAAEKAAKPAASAETAAEGIVPAPAVMLRVKDLVDRVAGQSDSKKKEVRDIVEAVLAELGKALDAGEGLNLPPLGKLRISRRAAPESGGAMTLKLRRGGAEKTQGKGSGKAAKNPEKEGLAEVGEDS